MRVFALALCFICFALPVQAAEGDLNRDLSFFYRMPDPDRAVKVFQSFATSPAAKIPNSHPPVVGFLAASFLRYPEIVAKVSVPEEDVLTSWSLAMALKLAGEGQKSDAMVARLHARGIAVGKEIGYGALRDMSPQTPTDFDVLWGASFATGDRQYVEKVLAYYDSAAVNEEVANDLLATIEGFSKKEDLKWLRTKYGDQGTMKMAFAATALWSFTSNARQHDFVRDVFKDYFKAHVNTPAGNGAICAITPDCHKLADLGKK